MEIAMKHRISISVLLLLLAACGPPAPNGPAPAGSGAEQAGRDSLQREMFAAWRSAQMPSVYALIGARERLKLSSAQVTALDSIAEAVREQNRPFADSLRRFTRSPNGGPMRIPSNDAQRRDFTAILQKMGANMRTAVAAVQALLDAEQRTAACALALEERQGRGSRTDGRGRVGGMDGAGGFGGGRGMRGMMRDSLGSRAGGWPWCASEPRGRGPRPAPG
jgi:hypothetical protein